MPTSFRGSPRIFAPFRLLGFAAQSSLLIGLIALISLVRIGFRTAASSRSTTQRSGETVDWPVYGGHKTGDRYSPLKQITRSNVQQLKVAWTFDPKETGGLQTNPLIVGKKLFAFTPTQKVVALEAATGHHLWTFDAGTPGSQPTRGFTYWSDGTHGIVFAGLLANLYALDPETGQPIVSFGEGGHIDMRNDLDEPNVAQSFAALTTPGLIYKDTIIVGFRAPETHPSVRGDIRAYDVRSGKLRWIFHTVPRPNEPGYETWPADAWKTAGAANNWAGMALDEKRGIVYVPTGSAVDDFYGGDRLGNDLYANTLLALDATTGKRLWHFQAVHHDIWDRDFPSPPTLVTVNSNGKAVDAVAQTTKQGFLFLFDRTTGKPLFPIKERLFPASAVPGERASPTQPIPSLPAPFARQSLTADMLTKRTPEAHAWAVAEFKRLRGGGLFVPLTVGEQTIVFPGFDGGAEWGGSALDTATGVLYVNANDLPWTGGLNENKQEGSLGAQVYNSQCSVCHGTDRKGSPPAFPSLVDVGKRLSEEQILDTVRHGRGRMPAFPNIDAEHLTALVGYLEADPLSPAARVSAQVAAAPIRSAKQEAPSSTPTQAPSQKYLFSGYRKFLDPDGYPAVVPPWGTLNAIDLNTGRYLWKVPLGEYPALVAKGMGNTGSENYGGPIVTAGGLVFISATNFDHKFRAFNSSTGDLLWSADLPFSGNATPATYMVDGRQYVVIATSGARDPKGPQGAAYVAFALPE